MFLNKKRIVFSLVFLCLALFVFNVNTSFEIDSLLRGESPFMTHAAAFEWSNLNPLRWAGKAAGSAMLLAFNQLFYGIFKFVGALVYIAGILFDWAVSAENFKAVMDMSAIQEGWKIVRDFLNIFFILVLLFSAFCTIFQVEKYHIKKILLTLVIMAMLVNFSFPISRFIIDAGNIPMYYFFQAIGGDNDSISKKLWDDSNGNVGLQEIILPGVKSASDIKGNTDQTFSLIAAIIFIFIFGITLLIIAILFIIRILVLAILVIFSPIGFVAAIFPSFSKYADDWWTQLFKQSFFGTIMAFMLYISLLIMNSAQTDVTRTLKEMAEKGGSGTFFDKVVVGGVTLAIPIVLLWVGIMAAQKMSGETGKMGMAALNKGRGWVNKGRGWAWKGTKGLAKSTGIPGGVKQTVDHYKRKGVFGVGGSERREEKEARFAEKFTGDKSIREGLEMKKMKEATERLGMEYKSNEALEEIAGKKNGIESTAAMSMLASRNRLKTRDENGNIDNGYLDYIGENFGTDSQIFRQAQSKVRVYDPEAAYTYKDKDGNMVLNEKELETYVGSNQFDHKKVYPNSFRNEKFIEIGFAQNAFSPQDLADVAKKGGNYKKYTGESIGKIVKNYSKFDKDDEIGKNINKANFAINGTIDNEDFAGEIFRSMDKNSAKSMDAKIFDNPNIANALKNNIKKGKLKEILEGGINDDSAKRMVNILVEDKRHTDFIVGNPYAKGHLTPENKKKYSNEKGRKGNTGPTDEEKQEAYNARNGVI